MSIRQASPLAMLVRRIGKANFPCGFVTTTLSSSYLMRSGEMVRTGALHRLDLTGFDLLEIYAMPAVTHTLVLLDWLDKGARFCPAKA